ncbi:lipid A ethanolaminephosphotransferase [Lysobacter niastensis]|uniref:Lipid A ethanolaminephosphotransferase n=1 Tax=Lysobacter niastensis TaxID=380629 RepID=A0ABU1W9K4_9GAMM|nr:phosphoethanolamine--lipid A transferase [Lysobacter niastensis]MDR7134285.1 lipid A ethanolaminephosphotransferase [Lysobacter niastensis]
MSTIVRSRPAGIASVWPALRRLADFRPEMTVERLALIAAGFFTLFCNGAFFRAVSGTGALHGHWSTAVSLVAMVGSLNVLLLCLLLNRWTAKPLLIALLLVTSVAAHFMSQYTVYLDADMIRNILHTDGKESGELVSAGMLPSLLTLGVLPSLMVWRVRLRHRAMGRAVMVRGAWVLLAVMVASGAALGSFQNLSALMRNHRELRHLVTPGNYLVSLGRVLADDQAGKHRPRTPLGINAHIAGRPMEARPRLLVLVVGETVRAQNWGLNGYARQTTPELSRLAPINFTQVSSCGSATEVSVPCMFSPWGRAHYDKDRVKHSESLLHVLEHAGIHTLWRDNQTGCKGVCDGLAFESFEHASVPKVCDAEGCMDEVMLQGLAGAVDRRNGDVVVVLHQLGNHGPAYYKRYPTHLRRFTPVCETSELGDCSQQQIVNAYDNAVLHTDEFLASTIRMLAAQTDRDTALIYLSDHGESLGENGLYLHGVPYAIAPETQTRVPMVMWLSSGFAASRGIDMQCMKREAQAPASQDNLFHSVLGLMQVSTPEYDGQRDLFRACSSAAG